MAASFGRLLAFCLLACVFVWYLPPWFGQELASRFVGVLSAVCLAYVTSAYVTPNPSLPVKGKAVLVTGCDTGIGYALARHLDTLGFCVFAGCLFKDGPGASKLKEASSSKLTILQLDVTSEEQVETALQDVQQKLKETGEVFWGVVNNAGLICYGEMEWIPIDMFKRVCEVNTWGGLRVTQTFLPLLRNSKGRIINISSIGGRFCGAYTGPYHVSKYSVEAISDTLRIEMAKWGIKVVIIEPGNYGAATMMFKREAVTKCIRQVWETVSEPVKQVYGEKYFEALTNLMADASAFNSRTDLQPVADAVTDGLIRTNPDERYMPAGPFWKLVVLLFSFLPATLMDHALQISERGLSKELPTNKSKTE